MRFINVKSEGENRSIPIIISKDLCILYPKTESEKFLTYLGI